MKEKTEEISALAEQPATEKKEMKTSIGGQALLEGIMMKGPQRSAMAVRNLQGEIVTEEWDTVTNKPAKIWTLPLFRGMYGMYTSMKIGYKCLMRSAMLSGLDELEEREEQEKKLKKLNKKRAREGLPPLERLPEEEKKEDISRTEEVSTENNIETIRKTENSEATQEEKAEKEHQTETAEYDAEIHDTGISFEEKSASEISNATEEQKAAGENTVNKKQTEKKKGSADALVAGAAAVGSVLGVALSILLFIYLPTQLYSWTSLQKLVENHMGASYLQMLLRSLFEGVVRIAIFVVYMAAVSLMKDIRRTFMYHGAEHKTIFCYEKGLPLTVENVRKMRRFHPRCGTSFMIVMLILGIIIGSFIPRFAVGTEIVNNLLRSLCKIALLPLTVGLGYEFIKFAGKHDNWFVRILSAPGLWMQRISTKEPEDQMIECAIVALEKVIPSDGSDQL